MSVIIYTGDRVLGELIFGPTRSNASNGIFPTFEYETETYFRSGVQDRANGLSGLRL